ncbi:MAG TPA: phosphoribosylglycinamide formyltransferase [Cytophagales bacterium]|nr:phosphoribosylglycinamide formyltransferase [Cytophagales bacterium]
MKKRIAIFASGSGTNAEEIIKYFKNSSIAEVALVLSNKPSAYVLERAGKHGIGRHVFDRKSLYETGKVAELLEQHKIDFIVLAGFLWLFPDDLVKKYPGRIVNIHPALLPKYGGKGMYGMKVHEAVVQNNERESGITIHFVNERYDEGQVIFQAKCRVDSSDSPDEVAKKVHELEYRHYPEVIEQCIKNLN